MLCNPLVSRAVTRFLANSKRSVKDSLGNTCPTHPLTRLVKHALTKAICNTWSTRFYILSECVCTTPPTITSCGRTLARVLHWNCDEHFKGWFVAVLIKVGRSCLYDTLQRCSCGIMEDSFTALPADRAGEVWQWPSKNTFAERLLLHQAFE